MESNAAEFVAALFSIMVVATAYAISEAVKHASKPKPECRRCRHDHGDHEQRFGDPGCCRVCMCFRYEWPQ